MDKTALIKEIKAEMKEIWPNIEHIYSGYTEIFRLNSEEAYDLGCYKILEKILKRLTN